MKTTPTLYELLYVSTIAPGAALGIVADIAGQARTFNAEHDITGLLIFDGMRFCQQLEGNHKEVSALIERIRVDPRHINVEIVHHNPLVERRFKRFTLAFASVDDEDVLGRMEQLDGQAAIDTFVALLPTLDLGS